MFTGIVIEKGKLLDSTDGVLTIGSSLATEGGQVGDSIARQITVDVWDKFDWPVN